MISRTRRGRWQMVVVALMTGLGLVLSPDAAGAGNGAFRSGVFNFCVSVRFLATEAQLAQIRAAFQAGSDVLADVTDGQHRFGTICIVNDSGASESAEYWVHAGSGRAYATEDRYGERGQHVNLYFESNFQARNGADGDAYTIAHEHVHHAYGVLDEYSGPAGPAEDAPPPDTATLNYSLMDNYFTRGGRAFGAGYTLNELCVATNHDPDQDTWQHHRHGRSAWEVIAAHPTRSATAPTGLPTDAPAASQAVTFKNAVGGLRVILVIDRSGSMSTQSRLAFAKLGAEQFIRLLRVGDAIGVVSFESGVAVNFPLTTITSDAVTAGAAAAVNALTLGGATNIGGGLQAALGQITSQPDRSCNEIIVLLSDGDHNTGTPPAAVLPSLQDENITVLSVGVGSGISVSGQATLQSIATQTGGKFFSVGGAFDLVGLFFQLAFESIGGGLLTRSPELVTPSQTVSVPVVVEAGADTATFAVLKVSAPDAVTLSLITPSGGVIQESDAGAVSGVTLITGPNSRALQVRGPEAGSWLLRATAGVVSNGRIEVLAFATQDGVRLDVAPVRDIVAYPVSVELRATPWFRGEAVTGVPITGQVTRPDGSVVSVELFDDGIASHGDAMANDGTYSVLFTAYSGSGTYVFDLVAVNTAGFTYSGEDLFDTEPSNTVPVAPYVRRATTTVVVTGVPVDTHRIISITPSTGAPGQTLDISITGESTHWVNGASVLSFSDSGITVNSIVVTSATTATANITIAPGVLLGSRDVLITTGGETAPLANGFTVAIPPTAQPPTGLYASSIVGNVVTFRWTSPAAGLPPTDFVIEGGIAPGQVLASISTGTAPVFTVTAPDGAFYVRVHTISGSSRSMPSNEIRIFVNQPVPPSAPLNLLSRVSGNSLALAWRNTFGGGAIESLILDVTGAATGSLPLPAGESASFAGVPSGTYTLRLRAANAFGASSQSDALVVTVPGACSGVPQAPAEFLAFNVGSTAYVFWAPPTAGPAPESYELIVTGGFNLTLPTTQRALSGIVPAGNYNLSVRSVNACGSGAATPVTTIVIP